jgi:hypothetical protein
MISTPVHAAGPRRDRPPVKTLPTTPFGAIIQRVVEATPGAVGGAFADDTGEMVDAYAADDPHEWAVLTAHYGVVMQQLRSAFGTWHYGSPEFFIARHAKLDIVVHDVGDGYFALLALADAPFALALERMSVAVRELRAEMS